MIAPRRPAALDALRFKFAKAGLDLVALMRASEAMLDALKTQGLTSREEMVAILGMAWIGFGDGETPRRFGQSAELIARLYGAVPKEGG